MADILQVPVNGQRTRSLLDWLSWGDNDYLAARRLLLDNLIVQGTALANTALEKYLKAVFALHQKPIPRVHNPLRLFQEVRSIGTLQLDESFLALLVKAYELRYPDDLEPGFNIVLSQALILNALDESVFQISRRFTYQKRDGERVQRMLDVLVEARDPRILTMNTALGTLTRDEILNQVSTVYEMRILANRVRMEYHYSIARVDNTDFNRDAFIQVNEKQFNLAFTPMQ
jgi:HEPN domain-containing protein